ncbi:hypothetical protein PGT21_031639 [Puccinia graminis f. sp. tritici]|uniref:Uncharacterized protein n=1 Tax=Puccinia graminis f. sp. tritici TaxID=56615 RepID=A0A5B0QK33_PUCGR|nr:hypothetical protein PGT21_031639 [Puccinia graminis f. sp. tritici]
MSKHASALKWPGLVGWLKALLISHIPLAIQRPSPARVSDRAAFTRSEESLRTKKKPHDKQETNPRSSQIQLGEMVDELSKRTTRSNLLKGAKTPASESNLSEQAGHLAYPALTVSSGPR